VAVGWPAGKKLHYLDDHILEFLVLNGELLVLVSFEEQSF